MLHLIQSNKMETLLAQLVESISNQGTSVLRPKTILVQSPGMAQWLKIQLGQALGIAANLRFPLPSSYIWEQYQRVFDDLPEQSAFSKVDMTWKIMALLPTLTSQPTYRPLRDYLQQDTGLKSFLLSQKIADVFDQYQMYRPHWLMAWEQGEDQPEDCQLGHHDWQPALWRELVQYTQSLGESTYHRANLHETLVQALTTEQHGGAAEPIYIFGLSAIPRQQLEVFQALATHTEVRIFWCNPSAHYWGDLVDEKHLARLALKQDSIVDSSDYFEVGNPLLSSWGKLGRDYLEMLMQIEAVQHDAFVETVPQSLLEHIQSEIMNLTMRGSPQPLAAEELLGEGKAFPKISVEQSDQSLTVHKCHSIVRELEVLHDHLLSCFADDTSLQPGDIIVMIPDVAQYAPYIEGVFGAANTNHFIPYAISDRNAADESTLIDSFLQLLCLHQSRMSVSELLSILDVPSVGQRFDIEPMEMEYIRFWLSDSGVRWGWDGEDKGRWQVPADGQNTWLFGLNRLLAGYAMDASDLYQMEDTVIAPYRDIEGQQALALGKLFVFSQAISDMLAFCAAKQSINEKVEQALAFLQRFYAISDAEQVYINQLRQTLEDMRRHQPQFPHEVDQDVFVQHLQQSLRDKGVGQRFLAGFVNFCTLMPMRSIPFKRVCMLGMNDGDYPRQTIPIGFDLMRISPAKKGDRSRRLDDRYLFLEALLCARQQLYISYLGMSSKDNSERNPSVLISELLEYCQAVFTLAKTADSQSQGTLLEHIICDHPLQPFSQRYFDGTSGPLKSYASHWLSAAKSQFQGAQPRQFLTGTLPEGGVEQDTIELDSLTRAWHNPAKFLFDHRWRCNLSLHFDQQTVHEPFTVSGLDRYSMIDSFLSYQLQGDSEFTVDGLQARLVAQGVLPSGAGAQIAFDALAEQAAGVVNEFRKHSQSRQPSTIEVDLALSGSRLQGWLDHIYGNDLILCRAGRLRSKDKLSLWISWLTICASKDTKGRALFVCLDKEYALRAVQQERAIEYLEQLVQGYKVMANRPVYCFPDAAFEWLKSADMGKTIAAFLGSQFSSGDASDAHVARLCPDLEAVFDEFVQHSSPIYSPIVEHEVKP